MDLMKALTSQYMKSELPEMNIGDTVRVHVKIKGTITWCFISWKTRI